MSKTNGESHYSTNKPPLEGIEHSSVKSARRKFEDLAQNNATVNINSMRDPQLQRSKHGLSKLRNLPANIQSSSNVSPEIDEIANNSPDHSNSTLSPKTLSYFFPKPQPRKLPIAPKIIGTKHLKKTVTKCYSCRQNAGTVHLACQHLFCADCLTKTVFNKKNAMCPFENGNYKCMYKLKDEDMYIIVKAIETRLDTKLNNQNVSPSPIQNIVHHQPPPVKKISDAQKIPATEFFYNDDINSGEVLYHCKQEKCEGMWFVDVNEGRNTYPCPVCEQFNNYSIEEDKKDSDVMKWTCQSCGYSDNLMEATDCGICLLNKNMMASKSTDAEYQRLIQLEESSNFITNVDEFECIICCCVIPLDNGVMLRGCFHSFCRDCITHCIEDDNKPEFKCPNDGCDYILEDREIKALISPQAYARRLDISFRAGKSKLKNGYQCCKVNCEGWWIFIEGTYTYNCTVCKTVNCITCRASHVGFDCKTYQHDLLYSTDKNAIETKKKLENMLKTGKAEHCPKCNIIVVKNGGCEHMVCSMCETKFNWGATTNRNLNKI